MEFVRRLTEQDVTPGTLDTAFSTRELQAAQLIPVTLYCSIINSSFEIWILCNYSEGSILRGVLACFLPKSRDIQGKMSSPKVIWNAF